MLQVSRFFLVLANGTFPRLLFSSSIWETMLDMWYYRFHYRNRLWTAKYQTLKPGKICRSKNHFPDTCVSSVTCQHLLSTHSLQSTVLFAQFPRNRRLGSNIQIIYHYCFVSERCLFAYELRVINHHAQDLALLPNLYDLKWFSTMIKAQISRALTKRLCWSHQNLSWSKYTRLHRGMDEFLNVHIPKR